MPLRMNSRSVSECRAVSFSPRKRKEVRDTVKIHKTITINAPVEKVFAFMNDPHHLPEIWPSMVKIKDVKSNPNIIARVAKYAYGEAVGRRGSLLVAGRLLLKDSQRHIRLYEVYSLSPLCCCIVRRYFQSGFLWNVESLK